MGEYVKYSKISWRSSSSSMLEISWRDIFSLPCRVGERRRGLTFYLLILSFFPVFTTARALPNECPFRVSFVK